MAEINAVIAEASQDLQTIEDFVNLPAGSDVRPRLLSSVNVGTLAGIRDAIFEAGGLPATPFATKALMTASALIDGDYAMVTDDTVNNGLYVKTAGAWVKSEYDPAAKIETYTDLFSSLQGYKNLGNEVFTNQGYFGQDPTEFESDEKYKKWGHTEQIAVNKGDTVLTDLYWGGGSTIPYVIFYDEVGNVVLEKFDKTSFTVRFTATHIAPVTGFVRVQHTSIGFGNSIVMIRDVKDNPKVGMEDMLGYVSGEYNLVDARELVYQEFITAATGKINIDRNVNGARTGRIKVNPSTEYWVSSSDIYEFMAEYDAEFNYISGLIGRKGINTFTTSETTEYIIVNFNYNEISKMDIVLCEAINKDVVKRNSVDWVEEVFEDRIKEMTIPLPKIQGFTQRTNLLYIEDIDPNNFIIHSTGNLTTNKSYPTVHASDFMPVKPNTNYWLSFTDVSSLAAEYDINKQFIKGHSKPEEGAETPNVITTSEKTAYIRVNINTALASEFIVAEGTERPLEFIPYSTFDFLEKRLAGFDGGTAPVSRNRFAGKKLLVTGDSITQNTSHTDNPWHGFLRQWLSLATVQNDGKSGTGLVKPSGSVVGTNYRIPTWKTKYNDPDLILIMGNMNDGTSDFTGAWDWIYGAEDAHKGDWTTIITAENMDSSLWFAMRYFCEELLRLYPNTPIGWISSTPRSQIAVKSGTARLGYSAKCWGQDGWYSEWLDVITEVCGHYSIPVLDIYHQSNMRPWIAENNAEVFSENDGIHPNTKGHEMMANRILPFVEQFI